MKKKNPAAVALGRLAKGKPYARTYDQELMPNSLLDEIQEFIDGFVDGAPDASATSKTANQLATEIKQHRGKVFFS